MQTIILATDSACDVPQAILEKNEIAVLPFHISFGTEDFTDGVTITRDALYQKVEETGLTPKTAAISPAVYEDFFAECLKNGDALVYLSIGSRFSSACQNAVLAASAFENVFVVDTNSLSSGEGLVLLEAIRLREAGTAPSEMAEKLSAYALRCDVSFVLDRLDYMHRGGRCSGVAALGANLLGIKPCIAIRDGALGIDKKYRGKLSVVIARYINERLSEADVEDSHVFLTDAGVEDAVRQAAIKALEDSGKFKTIYMADAGCVISSHCGPGTLGIIFVRK